MIVVHCSNEKCKLTAEMMSHTSLPDGWHSNHDDSSGDLSVYCPECYKGMGLRESLSVSSETPFKLSRWIGEMQKIKNYNFPLYCKFKDTLTIA